MLIQVDTSKLSELVDDGSKIVFSPEAEQALLDLLELRDKVEGAIKQAKDEIERTALKHNPNFKAVYAPRVVAGYQYFGSKYRVDEAHIGSLPAEFYKTKTSHSPDSHVIDEYLKTHDKLPFGLNLVERHKQITIKPKDKFMPEPTDES